MTGQLNEISAAIGALRAYNENSAIQQDRILDKLDEVTAALVVVTQTKDRMDKIEPLVNDHERLRQNGKGVIFGLSLAAGGIGGTIVEVGKMALKKIGMT